MFTVTLNQPARVIVNPNVVVRDAPGATVASFADADRVPRVGETVTASQPDDDGSDFIGWATVYRIDDEHQLIYLNVDWASFQEVAPATAGGNQHVPGTATQLAITWLQTARNLRKGEANLSGSWAPRVRLSGGVA